MKLISPLTIKIMKQITQKSIYVIATIVALTLNTKSTYAQFRLGARAGLNMSKMSGEGLSGLAVTMLPTYHVGGVAEYTITDAFALESGLFLSAKGTNASLSFFGANLSFKATPLYIEVPVNAVTKIDLGKAKLQLFAGPYLGIGVAGKSIISGGGTTEEETIKFGSDSTAFLKRTDLGINIGTGLEFNNIVTRIQYGQSLINIESTGTSGQELRNNVISFSVGYMFGRRK